MLWGRGTFPQPRLIKLSAGPLVNIIRFPQDSALFPQLTAVVLVVVVRTADERYVAGYFSLLASPVVMLP